LISAKDDKKVSFAQNSLATNVTPAKGSSGAEGVKPVDPNWVGIRPREDIH